VIKHPACGWEHFTPSFQNFKFEAEKIGFSSNFSIYDTSDSENAIKLILKELNFDPSEIKPRTIQRKISDAKNQLILPDAYKTRFVHSTLDDITARGMKFTRYAWNRPMRWILTICLSNL
jgi:superfamily I DNA/RNA helicase